MNTVILSQVNPICWLVDEVNKTFFKKLNEEKLCGPDAALAQPISKHVWHSNFVLCYSSSKNTKHYRRGVGYITLQCKVKKKTITPRRQHVLT